MWLLLLSLACSERAPAEPPTATASPAEAAPAPALAGTRVDPPQPPPAFEKVVAMDGTPRRPEDLRGRPTAVWFYPMAGTPG